MNVINWYKLLHQPTIYTTRCIYREHMYLSVGLSGGSPNILPVVTVRDGYILELDSLTPTALDPAAIFASDGETPAPDLVYNISMMGDLSKGYLIHSGDPHARPLHSFRQQDLEGYKILYHPPAVLAPNTLKAQVRYTVIYECLKILINMSLKINSTYIQTQYHKSFFSQYYMYL